MDPSWPGSRRHIAPRHDVVTHAYLTFLASKTTLAQVYAAPMQSMCRNGSEVDYDTAEPCQVAMGFLRTRTMSSTWDW